MTSKTRPGPGIEPNTVNTTLEKCVIDHAELFNYLKKAYPPGPDPDLYRPGKRAPYGAARHRARKTTMTTKVNGICTHTIVVDKEQYAIRLKTEYEPNTEKDAMARHGNLAKLIVDKVISTYKLHEILFGD